MAIYSGNIQKFSPYVDCKVSAVDTVSNNGSNDTDRTFAMLFGLIDTTFNQLNNSGQQFSRFTQGKQLAVLHDGMRNSVLSADNTQIFLPDRAVFVYHDVESIGNDESHTLAITSVRVGQNVIESVFDIACRYVVPDNSQNTSRRIIRTNFNSIGFEPVSFRMRAANQSIQPNGMPDCYLRSFAILDTVHSITNSGRAQQEIDLEVFGRDQNTIALIRELYNARALANAQLHPQNFASGVDQELKLQVSSDQHSAYQNALKLTQALLQPMVSERVDAGDVMDRVATVFKS